MAPAAVVDACRWIAAAATAGVPQSTVGRDIREEGGKIKGFDQAERNVQVTKSEDQGGSCRFVFRERRRHRIVSAGTQYREEGPRRIVVPGDLVFRNNLARGGLIPLGH